MPTTLMVPGEKPGEMMPPAILTLPVMVPVPSRRPPRTLNGKVVVMLLPLLKSSVAPAFCV